MTRRRAVTGPWNWRPAAGGRAGVQRPPSAVGVCLAVLPGVAGRGVDAVVVVVAVDRVAVVAVAVVAVAGAVERSPSPLQSPTLQVEWR